MKISVEAWIHQLQRDIEANENEILDFKCELNRAKAEQRRKRNKKKMTKEMLDTAVDMEGKLFRKNETVRILTERKFPLPKVKGLLGNITYLG